MSLYERFAALNLDTAPLGFEKRSPDSGYYCTPPGAQIFGWSGVDGIHYCFVPGCGDRVFAVSPMNPESETVHILARSFADFLRLVLACGSDLAGYFTQFGFVPRENGDLALDIRLIMREIPE